ncbi:uracil-DNA glycosylase family protein [Patescibacteria group bacterium]
MDKRSRLVKLKREMLADKSLPLVGGATNLVFGEGTADTPIVFIGEGPGFHEDQQGRPFVGRAGKLLDELLQSIDLDRSKVYITNVVHHRPPENRDPTPSEISAYGKYLDQMIDVISPRVIITLGRFSMSKFIPGIKITGSHGSPHNVKWNGDKIVVIPMYHPAAGLRNPSFKNALFEDFAKAKHLIDLVV